jgi:hypothetical protein
LDNEPIAKKQPTPSKDIAMNIANNSGVSAATSAAQAKGAGALQIKVLNKALDAQAISAATLIQSLPQAPALATSGKVGTKVNTYA